MKAVVLVESVLWFGVMFVFDCLLYAVPGSQGIWGSELCGCAAQGREFMRFEGLRLVLVLGPVTSKFLLRRVGLHGEAKKTLSILNQNQNPGLTFS